MGWKKKKKPCVCIFFVILLYYKIKKIENEFNVLIYLGSSMNK